MNTPIAQFSSRLPEFICLDCAAVHDISVSKTRCRDCRHVLGEERHLFAYLDREVPAHAGAEGMFQVETLEEEVDGNRVDRTYIVDQGILFSDLDELKRYASRVTGHRIRITEP